MKIEPDNDKLVYSGRIDWSHKKAPVFVFPCTSVSMRFTGKRLGITVENKSAYWNNYLGCIMDGKQSALPLPKEGSISFEIPVAAWENPVHEVMFFKRQDACHELMIRNIEIGEGEKLLDLPAAAPRRIEVYGDSVSAGEVSEAAAYVGKEDPEHNGEYSNSWYSYAWMTARKLNAQIHDIAQGGIALMDKTGWFYEPEAIGMETAWDKIRYNPEFGNCMQWDFSKYIPQVVIVAVGQNDNHPEDYMKEDYESARSAAWRAHYRTFLAKLRAQYPEAYIVCCTTLLMHDRAWDAAIGDTVKEMKDERISQYRFKRNGAGTPGHLRIAEAEEMAKELSVYIKSLNVEGWD